MHTLSLMWRIHIIATDGYMRNLFRVKDFSIKVLTHRHTHTQMVRLPSSECAMQAIVRLLAKCIDSFLTAKNGDRDSYNLLK